MLKRIIICSLICSAVQKPSIHLMWDHSCLSSITESAQLLSGTYKMLLFCFTLQWIYVCVHVWVTICWSFGSADQCIRAASSRLFPPRPQITQFISSATWESIIVEGAVNYQCCLHCKVVYGDFTGWKLEQWNPMGHWGSDTVTCLLPSLTLCY